MPSSSSTKARLTAVANSVMSVDLPQQTTFPTAGQLRSCHTHILAAIAPPPGSTPVYRSGHGVRPCERQRYGRSRCSLPAEEQSKRKTSQWQSVDPERTFSRGRFGFCEVLIGRFIAIAAEGQTLAEDRCRDYQFCIGAKWGLPSTTTSTPGPMTVAEQT